MNSSNAEGSKLVVPDSGEGIIINRESVVNSRKGEGTELVIFDDDEGIIGNRESVVNPFQGEGVLLVMVMGAFILGLRRKYPIHEYISAIFPVIGLILFTLADFHTSPNFSVAGVVMVFGAVIMDSFLGNLQEAIFTMNLEISQMEMLFCSTVIGLPLLIPPMILSGSSSGLGVPARSHLHVPTTYGFDSRIMGQVEFIVPDS